MKKSVRMADIAQQLGISTVSVSKALAGKPGVSEEMRTKVIALARQMGYSGVRIRYESGLAGNIGVLVSDRIFSENTFYTDLYRELVLCSGAEGFSCIMEITSPDAEQDLTPPPMVAHQRVDGIIFMGSIRPAYLEAVMSAGLPCLALDFRVPDIQIDSILRDNAGGGFLLTKHLLSAGYRQIGFAGNIDRSNNIMERYWGYQWALRQSGIVPSDKWVKKDLKEEAGLFFIPDELPEAFVCGSYETVFYLTEIWQRSGHLNDAKIALACFDDFRGLRHLGLQPVTYRVEPKRMAEAAIQHLVSKIRREITFPSGYTISGQLIMANELRSGDQQL